MYNDSRHNVLQSFFQPELKGKPYIMRVKYGGFTYDKLSNLGDQIQSIAAERFLPSVDKRFNRDTLGKIKVENDQTYLMIMNGWFTHQPKNCFPLPKFIYPVFWGFHITNWNNTWEHILSLDCIEYFKSHEPIGCRDRFTQSQLKNAGINSFYSHCLSLTFSERERTPKNGWNIVVDVPIPLPSFIENNSIRVSHRIAPHIPNKEKVKQAEKLLSLYKNEANLVITTRLHCALPCVAMGIPVVFLGDPSDYRTSIVSDIGLKVYNLPHDIPFKNKGEYVRQIQRIWDDIEWDAHALDFKKAKGKMIEDFKNFLHERLTLLDKKI